MTKTSTKICKEYLKAAYYEVYNGWTLSTAGGKRTYTMIRKDDRWDDAPVQVINYGPLRKVVDPEGRTAF